MEVLGPTDHVVVVGAGLAAWRFAEELRRREFAGAITIIGDEAHPPYDRPPLSKQVLSGQWPLEQTLLATPERRANANVNLLLGTPAVSLDAAGTTVTLADGRTVSGTRVVVATGTRARRLRLTATDVHYVRTYDDVATLGERLSHLVEGDTVAVIGAGFIGAEAATALRKRGLHPVVLEAASRPLVSVLGDEVAGWLGDVPANFEVELRCHQVVSDVTSQADGNVVHFADGTSLEARAVIAGVGAVPATEWLTGSGLEVENGLVVDANLHASPTVAALGDVARFAWPSVNGTASVRIEHWQVASDHAARLAQYWTSGEPVRTLLVPYFWSDQYGAKIQVLGHPHPSDAVAMVHGDVASGKWLALYHRAGVVSGVVTLRQPRALMLSKPLLESPTSLADALERAPWAV